jgi:urease accessory protein
MKVHSTKRIPIGLIACALWLLTADSAQAHIEGGDAAGFASGFSHPWSGLDHVLAMVAVGLLGAQLGPPSLWLLPVVFPMVMAMGGFLGLIDVPVPGVEVGIALSAVLLGAIVAFDLSPRISSDSAETSESVERSNRVGRSTIILAAILVGLFGLFHGHAHGTELPGEESALLYSIGFVVATGCIHALGILIGVVHRWQTGRQLLRVAGAGIAVMGCVFLWNAMA